MAFIRKTTYLRNAAFLISLPDIFPRGHFVVDCTPVPSALNRRESSVKKSDLLRALQKEILRHSFDTFVDEPPSIARGGKGVVVPGCPACQKRINTTNQFLHHLADDVLPALIDRLSVEANR
jgi:hypothetical protein